MRAVTERDIRLPEFRDANLADLEFRADGKVVRKDRWETGVHAIRDVLGDTRLSAMREAMRQALSAAYIAGNNDNFKAMTDRSK